MKRILTLSFALIFIFEAFVITCGTSGDEDFDVDIVEDLFEDVSTENSCFYAVQYLSAAGIIDGNADYFYPEEQMTSIQFLNWIRKCYQPDMTKEEFIEWYCNEMNFHLPEKLYTENTPLCWYQAINILFNVSGIYIYDADSYSEESGLQNLTEGELMLHFASSFGFCDESITTTDFLSRSDAAILIFKCLYNTFEADPPKLLEDFQIEINGCVNMKMILAKFELVPEVILKKFAEEGWTFKVSAEYMAEYNAEHYADGSFWASGVCRYNEKIICVEDCRTVVHELGHFLNSITKNDIIIKALFKKEGVAAAEEIREYTGTNSDEFFADFFAQYLSRNKSNREKLQEACPETYQYFVKLEANNWGL